MSIKKRARDRLVDAVSAADRENLEMAAEFVKGAWRGNLIISRPKRFKNISDDG